MLFVLPYAVNPGSQVIVTLEFTGYLPFGDGAGMVFPLYGVGSLQESTRTVK